MAASCFAQTAQMAANLQVSCAAARTELPGAPSRARIGHRVPRGPSGDLAGVQGPLLGQGPGKHSTAGAASGSRGGGQGRGGRQGGRQGHDGAQACSPARAPALARLAWSTDWCDVGTDRAQGEQPRASSPPVCQRAVAVLPGRHAACRLRVRLCAGACLPGNGGRPRPPRSPSSVLTGCERGHRFDPLGLMDPEGQGGFINQAWLQYSEVIHARWAMLGAAGAFWRTRLVAGALPRCPRARRPAIVPARPPTRRRARAQA